jgi:hypothetical protein
VPQSECNPPSPPRARARSRPGRAAYCTPLLPRARLRLLCRSRHAAPE